MHSTTTRCPVTSRQHPMSVLGLLTILSVTLAIPIHSTATPLIQHATLNAAKTTDSLRVATFNLALHRNKSAELLAELEAPQRSAQVSALAEIIQRLRPDVILLNEFDYDPNHQALQAFQQNYLAKGVNGARGIVYSYSFSAQSNTGLATGYDLNHDGKIQGAADAHGFGQYPGQYGMALLSQIPIQSSDIRTFQKFLWRDMPAAKLPIDPPATGKPAQPWFDHRVLEILRLSSKSHWDVPIKYKGQNIHLLASHPTPPVFDGEEDRNGRRNHDEIRFWADYVTSGDVSHYIRDDQGLAGGLAEKAHFVIMGDLNASPDEGDATDNPMALLLNHPLIHSNFIPISLGGAELRPDNPHAATHTASWGLRADYVLPSRSLTIIDGAVFWPARKDSLHTLTGHAGDISSDHRMVWLDLQLP